ncbi:TonB-dependent receptor [Parafilimonas sp.]|uniref:TonB-dependent receptor n=1 Tax=Parafilimonas sp. TaxID=1969739 RepID=UPI0039E4E095
MSVFCDESLLKDAAPVSIQAKQVSVQNVLNECLHNQKLQFRIENGVIFIERKTESSAIDVVSPIGSSQTLAEIMHGKVTDSAGTPIAGASVIIIGSKKGTVTNSKGEFSISANKGDVLEISYVGYDTKRITIEGPEEINVQLKAVISSLSEVMVVAYGTQKKINLTGAVDQINSKEIQDRPVVNIPDALQGKMANLNITTGYSGGAPDAKKSLNVRGFTGLSGTLASPLVIIDGSEGDINSINPNDVESISLLKDAASAAVYGSRAPNGVLIITTKQGKKNMKPRVTYTNNFSFAQLLNEPTMSSSLTFVNTMNEAYTNAGISALFPDSVITRIKAYMANPSTTAGTIQVSGSNAWADYDPTFGNANTDWFKVYLKDWATAAQQHNLSVQGGGENFTYYIAGGTEGKSGMYRYAYNDYTRNNIRANLNADVNKYISIGLKYSYAQENDKYPYSGGSNTGYNWFHQVARLWPIIPVKAPNGGYMQASYIPQLSEGGTNTSRNNISNIIGDITLKPLPGWEVLGHYNYNYQSYNIASSILPYYYSTPDNPSTMSSTVSSITKEYTNTSYFNWNIFTSYEKSINGHHFKILMGEQQEKKNYAGITGYNQNLYNTAQPSLSLTYGTNSATDDEYSWATISSIGRINYDYKEKYLLELDASYMGTSLFPDSTRYHLFKAFSAGWNISKENFFQGLTHVINNLKFRVSYGGLGDISYFLNASSYYPYLNNLNSRVATSTSWIFTPSSGGRSADVYNPTSLISPTLTWAKPSELDFGVDIDFLQDFSATFDWYRKNITDQFGTSYDYPATLGITAPTVNNAASVTKGYDITVNWHHQYGKLALNARGTFSRYSGKITKWDGNSSKSIGSSYTGEKIGAIWGFKTVGKFQSADEVTNAPDQSEINSSGYEPGDIQYADLDKDGVITYGDNTVSNPGDQTIIGNTTPKFFYGLTLGAQYQGIYVSVFLQGQGHTDYWPTNNYFWNVTTEYQSTVTPKIADRWTTSNPNGYFPRLDINNGSSKNMVTQSGYLLNAAYMRIKNLQLGYTIPDKFSQKYHFSQFKIYGSIDNLATFSGVFKHQYVDPELLQSDEKIYPLQRIFSIGVQVNIL